MVFESCYLISIGTLSRRLTISAKNFCLNLVFDVSFVIVIGSMFHIWIKLRTVQPLLHFDLHFISKKRLFASLFTTIVTFSKILKYLLERILFIEEFCKTHLKTVIWRSAGRILVPISRSLAVSYLFSKSRTLCHS